MKRKRSVYRSCLLALSSHLQFTESVSLSLAFYLDGSVGLNSGDKKSNASVAVCVGV